MSDASLPLCSCGSGIKDPYCECIPGITAETQAQAQIALKQKRESRNIIPGWKTMTCPVCQKEKARVGRPTVSFLGATPTDLADRFLIDVTERCEDCLNKLGMNRRNYGVPGLECESMIDGIERSVPKLQRKFDEMCNHLADAGSIDPNNFEPMKRVVVRGETA
jgi:hypothetical protein